MGFVFASKKAKAGLLVAMLGVVAAAPIAAQTRPQEASRAVETPEGWQAVAPGRVEPWSGEIRIAAPVVDRIGEVLVGVNDKVFAGEPLIRLEDGEARVLLLSLHE